MCKVKGCYVFPCSLCFCIVIVCYCKFYENIKQNFVHNYGFLFGIMRLGERRGLLHFLHFHLHLYSYTQYYQGISHQKNKKDSGSVHTNVFSKASFPKPLLKILRFQKAQFSLGYAQNLR